MNGWRLTCAWAAALIPFVLAPALLANRPAISPQSGPVTFEKDVLPIFRAHCTNCHEEGNDSGFLDLTNRELILEGGRSGPGVIPGDPEKSILLRRVLGLDGKPQMPKGFGPISDEKMATIRVWISQGALATPAGTDTRHWSYIPPVRPEVPEGAGSPIDRLVEAKLAEQGRSFSPEADRETLIRRVSLDLTGLPPTPEEIASFLSDREPDAYERVVNRLLDSPSYGERMARPWLDLARFADTNGYEKDERRQNWAWRDYVIRSYNEDKPFDQFTREQIAGDLLPNATREQLIATGFHRNTMLNLEGGTDPMEQRWLVLVDRVATTGTVWMGTSFGCAQCHDHKFDPISQKEFYQLLAFWESADEPSLPLAETETKPFLDRLKARQASVMALPDSEPKRVILAEIKAQIEALPQNQTLIFQESDRTAETPIRNGGVYLSPGEKVVPGVTTRIAPWSESYPKNRLGLAEWLISRENPLTARVQVNRVWELFFGRGLVKSLGDMGTQSEVPVQGALLDYLAVEFMDGSWRLKPLIKQIVMSRTYRQSSAMTEDALGWDPENVYLGRGARFRMEAEMIRDNALAIAGLLDTTIGGPSAFPTQPEGIWNIPYNGDRWPIELSSDRYRRGIYTFWRRTSPYPSFLSFDAASREVCLPGRTRTNTPLQALITLNDPVFLEAASGLATRMREADDETVSRIERGYLLALARKPSAVETNLLVEYQNAQEERLRSDGARDAEGESWRLVASVLLNLDETITKE
ncbi:MAG: DUF1553 domain-containing protein [Fimbriimonadaceae bacterium]|nr:DUF1553 domain-containing protein [Fimbriimonadaceae bacterium]